MGHFIYQVQSGDTLSELARRYRVPLNVLAESNGLGDVHRIWAGQFLALVSKDPENKKIQAMRNGY
ncbi:LysM peptidoglycan-binding domain-containing protein [Cystobacter fuscus]|uniref:LysM peptidoglycan-binding domain-containing protein n=1 Tax=Cystobacter fuscus TaxID=43 RepID=UPI002B2D701A|nr:LysM peptidoglycan-binding domain-containing protein [Cystobacter fuscus]